MNHNKLSALRPGMPIERLVDALGKDWKAPDESAEGWFFKGDMSARLTADKRIGELSLRGQIRFNEPVFGITLAMSFEALSALYPKLVELVEEANEYGWRFYATAVAEGWELVVGVRDAKVGTLTLRDPKAIYADRPYKYADPTLTEAFDLALDAACKLDDKRPAHGWCLGRPPGIGAARWPISAAYGIPMRHAFTLKLPEAYRTRGEERVAISVFVDEQFEKAEPLATPLAAATIDSHTFFMEDEIGGAYAVMWLTQAELDGPLTPIPHTQESAPWLTLTPAQYYGEHELPLEARSSGWKDMPGSASLDYGLPILVSPRVGDPNVGKPAREWANQNEHSGYVTAYSEEGQRLGLERFSGRAAHLGGTMFPVQGYPEFSPFYLELEERFGGFNFGSGVGQLDLVQMKLDWACG